MPTLGCCSSPKRKAAKRFARKLKTLEPEAFKEVVATFERAVDLIHKSEDASPLALIARTFHEADRLRLLGGTTTKLSSGEVELSES